MSNKEDKIEQAQDVGAFAGLEVAVEAARARIMELRTQLTAAQKQGAEMEELLRKFTGGEEDPAHLISRQKELETENQELSGRLRKGREGVERLLARIRYLEEQG